ncbi:hypothetical protein [Staphylococcus aureus]
MPTTFGGEPKNDHFLYFKIRFNLT